jgi:HTH-type transcriptional regulator/antitoxin HigA
MLAQRSGRGKVEESQTNKTDVSISEFLGMQQPFRTMKIIKSEKEYRAALQRLEEIFDAKKNTSLGDELELLSLLIDQYEKEKYMIAFPDPIEAIQFRMDQMGYKQKDLAEIIGLKSRVSEILNRKRKLTLDMIRKLHLAMNIPTEVLVREY